MSVSYLEYQESLDRLADRLEASRAELRDIATVGAVITSLQETNAVLSVVMDTALRMVHAEVGALFLEEGGVLKIKITWGVSDELAHSLTYEDGLDLPNYCFQNREPVRLSQLEIRHESGICIQSVICAPIKTSSKTFGALLLINRSEGGDFDEDDLERLEMLLSFVAVAIDNSQLLIDRLERQKMEQEMAIARQIQETILPNNIDEIPGATIGAAYFPAREVGGDFYDIIRVNDSAFYVIIGDVSSKGVPAALVMSAAAGIIKTLVAQSPEITVSDLAGRVNNILSEEIIREREMFVTLFFCRFDLSNHTVSYCNAGHMPGLFWDHDNQCVVELSEGGPIIGQFAGVTFKHGQRLVTSGDRLFLFTDGLTEAADKDGNLFGRERAEQVFSAEIGTDPKGFCVRVKEWVDRFAEGSGDEFLDDFTILQVKVQ
jgi:phosphoserine phosphatase RsbU/P